MNKTNINLGLIILSISIVISSIILSYNKVNYEDASNYRVNRNEVELSGKITADPVGINITTNSNDVSYNSELKIGEGEQLYIELLDGSTENRNGDAIVAKYFHVSKLLVVTYQFKEQQTIKYFNSPITWGNKK